MPLWTLLTSKSEPWALTSKSVSEAELQVLVKKAEDSSHAVARHLDHCIMQRLCLRS